GASGQCVRPDAAVPRDRWRGARTGRSRVRGRGPDAHVPRRRRRLVRDRTRSRRGVRRDPPRVDGDRDQGTARPTLARGDRGGGRPAPVKQIYPNSITGKGAVQGGSVLEHTFGDSDPYTLGVEEEHMLLDGETFDLV